MPGFGGSTPSTVVSRCPVSDMGSPRLGQQYGALRWSIQSFHAPAPAFWAFVWCMCIPSVAPGFTPALPLLVHNRHCCHVCFTAASHVHHNRGQTAETLRQAAQAFSPATATATAAAHDLGHSGGTSTLNWEWSRQPVPVRQLISADLTDVPAQQCSSHSPGHLSKQSYQWLP